MSRKPYINRKYNKNIILWLEYDENNNLTKRIWLKNADTKIIVDFTKENTLSDLIQDIKESFFFTGSSYNDAKFDCIKAIYDTKLPNIIVKQHTMNYEKDKLKHLEIKPTPKTYGELFSIMGLKLDKQKESIKIKNNDKEYIIYQVPELVETHIDMEDNVLYFGYTRY